MRSGNMPKSLYQNWQFAVEVNGFDVALFKKGQEPKTEFEEVAFAPAGSMFDQKVAGRVKFEDIALEKGILQDGSDEAAREWIKKQVDVNAVVGGLPNDYARHRHRPLRPRRKRNPALDPARGVDQGPGVRRTRGGEHGQHHRETHYQLPVLDLIRGGKPCTFLNCRVASKSSSGK